MSQRRSLYVDLPHGIGPKVVGNSSGHPFRSAVCRGNDWITSQDAALLRKVLESSTGCLSVSFSIRGGTAEFERQRMERSTPSAPFVQHHICAGCCVDLMEETQSYKDRDRGSKRLHGHRWPPKNWGFTLDGKTGSVFRRLPTREPALSCSRLIRKADAQSEIAIDRPIEACLED